MAERCIYADDFLDLFYVASAGQDKMFVKAVKQVVEDTPTADVAEVKLGWWKPFYESEVSGFNPEFAGRDYIAGYECSECGAEAILDCNDQFVLSNYCPNCGARMEGKVECKK